MSTDRELGRLRKKIESRDRKIAGIARKLRMTQEALALNSILVQRLPIDVEKAVQRALCNVRMIPVFGLRSDDKIVEVRAASQEKGE